MRTLKAFLYCFLLSLCAFLHGDQEKILQRAREENLPIIAIFLGGERCPWSQKFSREVLQDPGFIDPINGEAIVWTIPSPNPSLKQKFGLVEYPEILLLDPKGKEFARFGFLPVTAKEYLEKIRQTIQHFQEICIALEQNHKTFNEAKWVALYKQAKDLSAPYFAQVILEKGLKKEKGVFFHLEKLTLTLQKNKLKAPQVQSLKKELLKRDSQYEQGVHFKVALLEFQKLSPKAKSKGQTQKALKPLLQYLSQTAQKDLKNRWKAELAIAEFLFEKHLTAESLIHMQAAYEVCPAAYKAKIAKALKLIDGLTRSQPN
jgi:hypothetical protein